MNIVENSNKKRFLLCKISVQESTFQNGERYSKLIRKDREKLKGNSI